MLRITKASIAMWIEGLPERPGSGLGPQILSGEQPGGVGALLKSVFCETEVNFASAFDTDDWLYRVLTILQMGGVLVLASGLPAMFEHDDFRVVIYGYVMTAVFGYTVDMIMAGNQQSSQVFIVTHDYEKMAQAIVDNIHRGVTLIDSQGWYTKKESKIVMVVCRKRETTMILKFVKTIDPEAFMTVGSVMGVYGKGFQAISKP